MTLIRTLEDSISVDPSELAPCHKKLFEELKSNLGSIKINAALRNRSYTLKPAIQNANVHGTNFQWKKISIFTDSSLKNASAGYLLDARAECGGNCGSFHQVNVVICLNNRETIGTNFLKLEVAAMQEIRNHKEITITDQNILGILITLDRSFLNLGNWNHVYADATEYSLAYAMAYKWVLKSNICSIQLHAA